MIHVSMYGICQPVKGDNLQDLFERKVLIRPVQIFLTNPVDHQFETLNTATTTTRSIMPKDSILMYVQQWQVLLLVEEEKQSQY